jgi:hypothetical protein
MILGNTMQERRLLYHYNVRRFDGSIWLAFRMLDGSLRLVEFNNTFPDGGTLLGEVRTRIVGDRFVHTAEPLRDRTPEEMRRRARATARHKAYRAECWQRYSFAERVADLRGL